MFTVELRDSQMGIVYPGSILIPSRFIVNTHFDRSFCGAILGSTVTALIILSEFWDKLFTLKRLSEFCADVAWARKALRSLMLAKNASVLPAWRKAGDVATALAYTSVSMTLQPNSREVTPSTPRAAEGPSRRSKAPRTSALAPISSAAASTPRISEGIAGP